jgi:hypothetical protein
MLGALLLALLTPLALLFMPERWTERMDSIADYQADNSAMGRINAWNMAYNRRATAFSAAVSRSPSRPCSTSTRPIPPMCTPPTAFISRRLANGFVGLGLYLLLGG